MPSPSLNGDAASEAHASRSQSPARVKEERRPQGLPVESKSRLGPKEGDSVIDLSGADPVKTLAQSLLSATFSATHDKTRSLGLAL